jgi:hypothetical protein
MCGAVWFKTLNLAAESPKFDEEKTASGGSTAGISKNLQ